jgi:hypothetical protein
MLALCSQTFLRMQAFSTWKYVPYVTKENPDHLKVFKTAENDQHKFGSDPFSGSETVNRKNSTVRIQPGQRHEPDPQL